MEIVQIEDELKENTYPGRGIVLGLTADAGKAVIAYFIMGRSENSRNRIFVKDGDGLRTKAYDPDKLKDPSLIIYAPVRVLRDTTIVSNGDQTDTIYAGMDQQMTFEQSLRSRTFEPDAPNYTPRISGVLHRDKDCCHYALSIIKSENGEGKSTVRQTFAYAKPIPGEGHFLHTYQGDGNPLPSFEGEPVRVAVEEDVDAMADRLWVSLNTENKVALFVRYIDLSTGQWKEKIINKHQ